MPQSLDAIANVPWADRLNRENDRDTQRRMRQHREREARYNALDDRMKAIRPRVMPYPEAPDRVFPGTVYFRMRVGLDLRYVFVVDMTDELVRGLFNPNWQRPFVRGQTKGYWIVPHFIYRDEAAVTLHKDNWKKAYEHAVQNGGALPEKFIFDSSLAALNLPNGQVNDCYYVPGISNNGQGNPPPIKDPIFSEPFVNFATLPNLPNVPPPPVAGAAPPGILVPPPIPLGTYTIKPFPYDQPSPPFPQRVDPPRVDPPAPAAPAPAGGAPAPPPAPLVHPDLLTVSPPTYQGRSGVDWIEITNGNLEIMQSVLKDHCMQAEDMDYQFALSIQGLRGASLNAVWNCTDPEYDMTDRTAIMAQFVRMYMERFYKKVDVHSGNTGVDEVVQEALSMHEEFCKGWVACHHRTLTPEVTSAAESLVGLFYNKLEGIVPVAARPYFSRVHMARLLRRHKEFSGEFATCLYHYMTSLDHMRGNRNASYRSMQNERAAHITAMRRMDALLTSKFDTLKVEISNVANYFYLFFNPYFIDWHYIAGQLPTHHRAFEGYVNNFLLYRTRPGGRGNQFPPWQQMRFRT